MEEIISRGLGDAPAHLDLADLASMSLAIDATASRFGALDVFVANAVRWPQEARGRLADVGGEDWARRRAAPLHELHACRGWVVDAVHASAGASSAISMTGLRGGSCRRRYRWAC